MSQLRRDYKKCERIIKKNSKTFYKAFSMLTNEDKKNAVYAVYAYCRYADDIIDQSNDLAALNQLKKELDDFVRNEEVNNFIFRALLDVRKKFYQDFDFKPFYDMLEGQYMDLNFKPINSLEELRNYATKVASSVGMMLTPILAPNGNKEKLDLVSYHLGVGMQITNILRDIGEDYKINRIYLPSDLMSKYNYKISDLAIGLINDDFMNLFNEIAFTAKTHYRIALENMDVFPKEERQILTYALVLYREIIDVIIENGYDVFSRKQSVSEMRKIKLIKEYTINE
ncbi:phytoene/squalene synthase family protein [Acholeplasma hippikon]|uniref:Dehydrosqualene synthase n=1 Tax=Acholeplasma hippikon TaxID=264636 RepID=A0A449BIH6_9MOLU|nr:phytoene/squalene synthase family protein [Acholeplasma hippikon]VEU82264.1 Dehydrosqualene synthase [Acholeplasma hippikon]